MRVKEQVEDCIKNLEKIKKEDKEILLELVEDSGFVKVVRAIKDQKSVEREKIQAALLESLDTGRLSSVNPMVLEVFLNCIIREILANNRHLPFSTIISLKEKKRDFATKIKIDQDIIQAKETFISYLRRMGRIKRERDYWALLTLSLAINTHLNFRGLPSAVAMLKWGDVDLNRGFIFFTEESWKKKYPLRVWMDPVSLIILGAWRKKNKKVHSGEFIFPTVGLRTEYHTRLNHLNRMLSRIFKKNLKWRELRIGTGFPAALLYSADVVSYLGGKLYSPPFPLYELPEAKGKQSKSVKDSDLKGEKSSGEEDSIDMAKEIEKIKLNLRSAIMKEKQPVDEVNFITSLYEMVIKTLREHAPSRRSKRLKEALRSIREEVLMKDLSGDLRKNLLYFMDFVEYSLTTKWKLSTIIVYLSHLVNLPVDFWLTDFSQMDEEDIQEIFTLYGTVSSLRNYKPAIKAFFSFLQEKKGIKTQVDWKKLKTEKKVKLPEHFISERKYYRIFRFLYSEFYRLKKKPDWPEMTMTLALNIAVFLGYRAGLRISEVTNLKIKDVWFEDDKMWVYIEKGKSQSAKRKSFITPESYEAGFFNTLKNYHAFLKRTFERNERFIMKIDKEGGTYSSKPISPSDLSEKFSRTCRRLGFGPMRFHLLRHAFASGLREKGLSTVTILKSMGHLTPEVTYGHYINNLDLMQREALRIFWRESKLLKEIKITPLLQNLGLAKQTYYLWTKKNRKTPSLKTLLEYLRKK